MKRRIILINLILIICVSFLTGCEVFGKKIVFTTGFSENELFVVNSKSCMKNEYMVYLTTAQNEYENAYDEQVWTIEKNGVTLKESIKDTVLAQIAQTKTMCLFAGEEGILLDSQEENLVKKAAEEYFDSLNETEKELMGVDIEVIENLYRECALAQKVYNVKIADINPEISDDEARIITVMRILLKKGEDSSQNRQKYKKANEIRNAALNGETEFLTLANEYSEADEITISFGKGEMDKEVENITFSLGNNEISEVIETGQGYEIYKCVSTFDREETDINKDRIMKLRKNEAFDEVYEKFTGGLVKRLNRNLLEEINLIENEEVKTCNFFDVFDKYFD